MHHKRRRSHSPLRTHQMKHTCPSVHVGNGRIVSRGCEKHLVHRSSPQNIVKSFQFRRIGRGDGQSRTFELRKRGGPPARRVSDSNLSMVRGWLSLRPPHNAVVEGQSRRRCTVEGVGVVRQAVEHCPASLKPWVRRQISMVQMMVKQGRGR